MVRERPDCVFFVLTRRPHRMLEFATLYGPMPDNFWVGTSAENQQLFDTRVKCLSQVPAKYKAVSLKPLMSEIDITKARGAFNLVIAGGESGLGVHPVHPDWLRKIRDDCQQLDLAFQFHQWGSWGIECGPSCSTHLWVDRDGRSNIDGSGQLMHRVGCAVSGRVLDGAEWDEYPDAR